MAPDTESKYNDAFWLGLDGVCNALDNLDARLYIDSRCVNVSDALRDGGALLLTCVSPSAVPEAIARVWHLGYDGQQLDMHPQCDAELRGWPTPDGAQVPGLRCSWLPAQRALAQGSRRCLALSHTWQRAHHRSNIACTGPRSTLTTCSRIARLRSTVYVL